MRFGRLIAQCTLFYVQELAFRSAILYGGLLISNAFGSVSRTANARVARLTSAYFS
jgi:hypothetical protein